MATITVSWGPYLKLGERWTPSRINQIFEGASFLLEGSISQAQKPPGGISGDWMANNFITSLSPQVLDPQAEDLLLVHDMSLGRPTKVSVATLLGLGFSGATAVTTLTESDEFNVLVAGVGKKISLPNSRREIQDPPSVLGFGGVDILADTLNVLDVTAPVEVRKVTAANLVRTVTDRVVDTAGSNAFVVGSGYAIGGLARGLRLIVKFHQDVQPGATLAVDGLGAKALRTADDGVIVAGALLGGRIVELIYDTAAALGAGGWLVQGLLAKAPAWVVFDQRLVNSGVSNLSNKNLATTFGSRNVGCTAHGLTTGRVVTLNYAVAGSAVDTPYYVYVVDLNTLQLCPSKAQAVSGGGIVFNATASDLIGRFFTVDPILAQEGVDGVIWHNEKGNWFVDFASDRPNANFPVLVSGMQVENGDADFQTPTGATVSGVTLKAIGGTKLSPRVTVYCP